MKKIIIALTSMIAAFLFLTTQASANDIDMQKQGTNTLVAKSTIEDFSVVGVTFNSAAKNLENDVKIQYRTYDGKNWSAYETMNLEDGPNEASQVHGTEVTFVSGTQKEIEFLVTYSCEVSKPQVHVYKTEIKAPAPAPIPRMAMAAVAGLANPLSSAAAGTPDIHPRSDWAPDNNYTTNWPPRNVTYKIAVVHHDAGSNDYSQAQVPGILQSIYRYHAYSLGWGDIGYNFLVDKYGGIWEGRGTSIAQTPAGGHALNPVNQMSFGVSMLGNYETASPTAQAIKAMADVIGWKFQKVGINPLGTISFQSSEKGYLTNASTIVGHRDVGNTACPGRNLYPLLPQIRQMAASWNTVTVLTQRYIDLSNGQEIHVPENYIRDIGSTHVCTPRAIAGYDTPDNQTATMVKGGKEVVFYYLPTGRNLARLTQKHVDNATGKEIYGTELFARTIGPLLCTPKDITGYEKPANQTVVLAPSGTTVTFRYNKLVTLTQRYVEAGTGREIRAAQTWQKGAGTAVECSPRFIEGYQVPANQKVVMGASGTTVTFEYAPNAEQTVRPRMFYQSHVQNKGWMTVVGGGAVSGTVGQGLRMESIRMFDCYDNIAQYVNVETHVQNIGWGASVKKLDGRGQGGTEGQGLRVEAFRMTLGLGYEKNFDIYYCAHVQNVGWQDWVKNGETAGTEGSGLRLEGYAVVILPKGSEAPGKLSGATNPNAEFAYAKVTGIAHVQNKGNTAATGDIWNAGNPLTFGTTGQSLRVENMEILENGTRTKAISISAHIQNVGDVDYQNGFAGTSGRGLRMEAVRLKLNGDLSDKYDIYYRGHVQNYGWLGWTKNGEAAGSEGKGLRVESVQVVIVPKGADAPGSTDRPLIK